MKTLLFLFGIVLFAGFSFAQDGIWILNDFEGEEDYNELFSTWVTPIQSVPHSDVKFSYVDDAYHGNKSLRIDWIMACGNPDWGGAIKCKLFNQDTTKMWDWSEFEYVKFYFKVIAPPDPFSDGDPVADQNRFRVVLFEASEIEGAEKITGDNNHDFSIDAAAGMEYYFYYLESFGYTILEESDWQEVTIPLVQATAQTEEGFYAPSWMPNGDKQLDLSVIAAYCWEISGIARQLHDPTNPDSSGAWTCSMLLDYVHLTGGPTAVEGDAAVTVNDFRLHQNFPNPFNPVTTINYEIGNTQNVTLSIYNLLGQEIRTLVDARQPAGSHSATWNGLDNSGSMVESGIYLYKLQAGNEILTNKMILMK